MSMKADIALDAREKTFASGLLPELIAAPRHARPGDLLAVVSARPAIGGDLEAWCRFTRNTLIGSSIETGRTRVANLSEPRACGCGLGHDSVSCREPLGRLLPRALGQTSFAPASRRHVDRRLPNTRYARATAARSSFVAAAAAVLRKEKEGTG
jgi:hypothetical protein